MILSDLAAAVRKSGLPVVEVDGWKSRGHGPFVNPESIICHHTAGSSTGNMPSLGVITHGRAGLSGPLCNLGLGRDGTVYVVAAGIGWHAGVVSSQAYSNTHAIGIEAEATGVSSWPEKQMDAYARLCAALCEHYDIPVARVLGHKEVASPRGRKIDPNFDMGAFRDRVKTATTQEDDMTPDQIASAPVTLQRGENNDPWPTTVQGALTEIENSIDGTQKATAEQIRRVEGRLNKKLDALTALVQAAVDAGK